MRAQQGISTIVSPFSIHSNSCHLFRNSIYPQNVLDLEEPRAIISQITQGVEDWVDLPLEECIKS